MGGRDEKKSRSCQEGVTFYALHRLNIIHQLKTMKGLISILLLTIALTISTSTTHAQDEGIPKLAPDFAMTMEDGSTKMLSDFRGEVIYISFWASWCGPCISNFKKYEAMRSQLSDIGITLLNVSIDETSEAWTTSMDKQQLSGVNALSTKGDLYPDYQISSIPLYEIIGKNGYFKYLSDDMDRDIIEEFRSFLKE